jgi:hypothetical protein
VIWLDYDMPLTLWRLLRRTIRRLATRELLWNRNRETVRGQFFSRDSLFVWALKSHGRRRREYHHAFNSTEHSHLVTIRLPTPKAAGTWLCNLDL